MFGLGKKKTGKLSFTTDIHCHILPGLDDGAKSLDESLEMALLMEQAGIREIYATPHIKSDIYPNDRQTISEAAGELKGALEKNNIAVKLHYAAEYFIDMFFIDKLDSGEELLTLDGRHILVESSMQREPLFLYDVLFRIQSRGYRPVMAHPERYVYYGKDPSPFRKMRKAGCLLQMNLLSLSGHYGKPAQDIARMLVKNNLFDLIGTDAHGPHHGRRLTEAAVAKTAGELVPLNDKLFSNA